MKILNILVTISILFGAHSVSAATESFSESENRILRGILNSIAPVKTADAIYCSFSEGEIPHKNPIVFCGVEYMDHSRWLAKFRTRWISNRVLNLLMERGQCEYVDGWTSPKVKPYRCQLKNVSCAPEGCSAD